ncbi:glycogen/starch/alpha-glucan phosphorylase [Aurantimonas endophytica]|uniref:Alpha-1,4 glucan phosphorylase n=1 Tax=Aurantimonas endophytica TaxID=1522175 RepID=A0A7W6HD64_9HYPH|nr:glycogen/starch/alpha-glucan phosphorylase [Aurantimonas endophytica]MBB4002887.1 starch phosphorylase [Aurantimonas endophytica]MCO6403764.1 glycogen/starch/alpha-glucan family phosphorylase [Aurantimonas endophytica]
MSAPVQTHEAPLNGNGVLKPEPRLNDPDTLARQIVEKLTYSIGKNPASARKYDWLRATTLAVRDRIMDHWFESADRFAEEGGKRVCYLSMEFLIGRMLRDAINNLGLTEPVREALSRYGVELDMIELLEPDAALGNGGLGRLAACFMESMASTGVPGYGYGIRYVHGFFRQEIADGAQVELPETWLVHGNPWEFERRNASYEIGFGGKVSTIQEPGRPSRQVWRPAERVLAVAYDTPMVGWRGRQVNTLRLWSAQALDPILLDAFNSGDHIGALVESNKAEAITRVLYPADSHQAGQELRLRQEYFFSSASLQDIIRRHLEENDNLSNLADKVAIQLNDTHPAVSVAELMRLLIDVHGFEWDEAWKITRATFSYTNHTLLPEALEHWPIHLFERLLPRQMQIIYAINTGIIREAAQEHGYDDGQVAAISLIDEGNGRRVRMGQLAFVGSHAVNGVSALHTDLMKQTVFRDLHALYPDRIQNKTNGVTPRRWLMEANPGLTGLITEAIGPGFLDDIEKIIEIDHLADDAGFRERFAAVKRQNKERLANIIGERMATSVDPGAIFDIQVKRIHEYKRQFLNIIEAIALYDQIRSHPERDWTPRVKIFAGKAAPSYVQAKEIIHLANDVGRVINADPAVRDLLKVVFIPNYNVSLAEIIMPAADLSEQISTAGLEASGTGNMKFALNGALTIGTLDGANVEMLEHVGEDNIFIFGLTASEVAQRRREAHSGRSIIDNEPMLREALDAISSGLFCPDSPSRFHSLVSNLYNNDWWMICADFRAYWDTQRALDGLYTQQDEWQAKAVHNTARMGWFSSDRSIREYARDIWKAGPDREG